MSINLRGVTTKPTGAGVMRSIALAIALTMGLPAVADEMDNTAAKTGVVRSVKERAANNVTYGQTAQFALPKPADKGKAPAPQIPKVLPFEYAFGIELESPYRRNADLDRSLSDNSLIATPSVFGTVTYRPTDWLESSLELKLERPYGLRGKAQIILPDEPVQPTETRLTLFFDEIFVRIKPPGTPIELTVGRRKFEDARLWLYDTSLDALILTLKPGDFHIEASVSRENFRDLDLIAPVSDSKINNWILYTEYRGIEDHKFAGYWIHRNDLRNPSEEGRPQHFGVRAQGRPSDSFNYWTELAYLRGSDESSQRFSGYAFEVGGTYRFLDLPLQPNITLRYAFGSGDNDPNDNRNTQFRQTGMQTNEAKFGGVTQFKVYGETLDPELSNLKIFTAGIGLRPAASIFVELVYHHYRLNAVADEIRGSALTAQMNQVGSRLSKDVGSGLDIILGFRNLFGVRGLALDARAGLFFPGDAFVRERDSVVRNADKGISFIAKFFY